MGVRLVAGAMVGCAVAAALGAGAFGQDCGPPEPLGFADPRVVDAVRTGTNPVAIRHPSGDLLLTAEAGLLTQDPSRQPDGGMARGAPVQAPVWRSVDGGLIWTPAAPRPSAGTSGADLAVGGGGTVYHSDATPAETLVSRSSDGGRSFFPGLPVPALQRPWLAADPGAGLVHLVGAQSARRWVYRSTDGGLTFARAGELPGGWSKPSLDGASGALYASYTRLGPGRAAGTIVAVARLPGARTGDYRLLSTEVAGGLLNLDADATAVDAAGSVYVIWTRRFVGDGTEGLWYAYSTDGGATFSAPVRVVDTPFTIASPGIAAGRPGRVVVAWLQSSTGHRREQAPVGAEWRVWAAVSTTASGCGGGPATWAVSQVSPAVVHRGPICSEPLCGPLGSDGRMGDLVAVAVNAQGRPVVIYPDTTLPDPLTGRPPAAPRLRAAVALSGPAL